MTTFTWKISDLERTNDDDKSVVVAHWCVDAVDGDYTKRAYSTAKFRPDPTADGYVAFADLTEATVLGWVQESLGGSEGVAQVEAALQRKIDEQKNPPTVAGVPWGN